MKALTKIKDRIADKKLELEVMAETAVLSTPLLRVMQVCADDPNIKGGIKVVVNYAVMIVQGVGAVYGIMSIVQWFSAMNEQNGERAKQNAVNVGIAIILIAILQVIKTFFNAVGGGASQYIS